MRLHTLQLQAFLAFPDRERIDFDTLNDAGLFLLTGRTGAGKTTVLDAISFALYGQVPGARGIKRLRSDHADPGTPTEVELELTVRGRRLRIVRRPEQERPKVRGSGTTMAKAEIVLSRIEEDGGETVLSTRLDEAGHELGELLGMTAEQFCQVVMLPQGGFQKFLHAPTKERIPLLRELFDVRRFSDLERWLDTERVRAVRAADAAMRDVRDTVAAARHVATAGVADETELPPEDWEADPGLATSWIDEQVVVAEAQHVTAKTALDEAAAAREAAETRLAAASTLAEQQAAQAAAAAELAAWEATRSARDGAEAELALARRAAPAAARVEAWDERSATAAAAAATATAALQAARAAGVAIGADPAAADLSALADGLRRDAGAAETLLEIEESVDDQTAGMTALRARTVGLQRDVTRLAGELQEARDARPALVTAVETARAATAALPGLQTAAAAARERATQAVVRDRLAGELARTRDEHLRAGEAALAAAQAHVELQHRRLDGFAAELASRLNAGEPCAVCGSVEHPSPAAAPDDGLVSESDLAAAAGREAELGERRDVLAAAAADLQACLAAAAGVAGTDPLELLQRAADAAERGHATAAGRAGAIAAAQSAVDDIDGRIARLSSALEDARLELTRAAADLEQREGALLDMRARVDAARAGAESIAARVAQLSAAADGADAAASALATARRVRDEATQARTAAESAAAAAGFASIDELSGALRADGDCHVLEQTLRTWDETLTARRTTAEQESLVAAAVLPAPDLPALSTTLRNAKAAEGTAQDALQTVLRRRSELRSLSETLAATLARTRPLLERRATVVELAELAAGRSTSNRFNMSLSTYVLAARLEAVAAAATLRLQGMTDGRYALEHADDTAKGRSLGGLDLRVVDAWTGDSRPPSTLSGGETFMASLALALGLADTVTAEAGGLRLDTLFVDEGFGSLDDEGTLDNVLEALDALREGGRTVGVVSHVAELRQRIPAQVKVVKDRRGSTIAAVRAAPAA